VELKEEDPLAAYARSQEHTRESAKNRDPIVAIKSPPASLSQPDERGPRRRKPPNPHKEPSPFISNPQFALLSYSTRPSLTHVVPFNGILGAIDDVFGPDLRSPNATDYPKFETIAERRERRHIHKILKKMKQVLPESATAQWVSETENITANGVT